MLRRLDLGGSWRSLDKGFWPDDLPLGRRTIVYGHNGSGKSTLSELLLNLVEGPCPADVVWEDEQKRQIKVQAGESGFPTPIAVFTRKWVSANLSDFLDGASAAAIVTLGEEAIEARAEEVQLVEAIGPLRDEAREASERQKAAEVEVEALARAVQESIVSRLQEFDYRYFTKSRFSLPKVQDDLRKYEGEFPDDNACTEALKRLGEGAPSPVAEVVSPSAGVAGRLTGLAELLAETPTRIAIQTLEGNSSAQTWVEAGLILHKDLDHCLFCAGEIDSPRRDELARHFDESWLQIRSRAQAMRSAVVDERNSLTVWRAALPPKASLASDLQSLYEEASKRTEADLDYRVEALVAIEEVLNAKIADPSATPEAPDWAVLSAAPGIGALAEVVAEHNEGVRRHADITAERKQTVLDHLVGSQCEKFRDREKRARDLAEKSQDAKAAADLADRRLTEVRLAQFTTTEMANSLTRDLARVYGKDHLSVVVTPDGKSYACRRGDEPGRDLSEGERTTLSLLYFLRRLEDQQASGDDRSQRIVVIDDPSSSLDREALFATHQWLLGALKGFGQYIILTHDFGLLRLCIKSHGSALGRSSKRIEQNDPDEIRFPGVSFLEMYAAVVDGERRSRVGRLPQALLKSTSEYAYLFSMVMSGIADSEDHERLFLLPNAARRILEVFASHEAPHRPDFLQQLEVLVEESEGEPYRDVYDFCNRFSHGEGNESVDVLDARAVHRQIRRCMEFLRAVDSKHFVRMCEATGTDPATLP